MSMKKKKKSSNTTRRFGKKPTTSRSPTFNSTELSLDKEEIDVDVTDSGYNESMGAKCDTLEGLRDVGAQDFDFHSHLWIEENLWKDYARDNDKYKTWPESWRTHFTHQGNSHECVTHAFTQCFEITWNRQRMSKEDCVWFSPLSLYSEANPNIRGGTYLHKVLRIARERGVLPENNGPEGSGSQKLKFKHTLHQTAGRSNEGGGPWVTLRRFPVGWKDTARHFKPDEVINISSWQQIICCLLRGLPVWVGRAGHSIPYTFVGWEGNSIFVGYPDSYNVIRYDSIRNIRASANGALAIASTTIPDDWEKPAGEDMIS